MNKGLFIMGQLNNRFHHVWYGTCGEHGSEGCKPFIFSENPTVLQNVEMISAFTNTTNNSLKFFKPATNEGDLTSMECGGMYSIVLRDHTQNLQIDGVTPAGSGTTQNSDGTGLAVKVSFTCDDVYVEPTPTPTPLVCIPETAEIAKAVSTSIDQTFNFAGNIFRLRNLQNCEVGIDISNLTSSTEGNMRLLIPSQNYIGLVDISGAKPKSDTHFIYLKRGDACYRGEVNDSKIINNIWNIPMELIFGEEPVVPTPTPKPPTPPTPTPTPVPATPTPTPTPQPPPQPITCCEDGFTELSVSEGLGTQEHIYSNNAGFQAASFVWNVLGGGTFCVDATPNGQIDLNPLQATQKLFLSDNPSQQIGVFAKLIKNSDNKIYYSKDGNCYIGTWNATDTELILTLQS